MANPPSSDNSLCATRSTTSSFHGLNSNQHQIDIFMARAEEAFGSVLPSVQSNTNAGHVDDDTSNMLSEIVLGPTVSPAHFEGH